MRTILKFDTGADGFKKMVYVLAVMAILLVIFGVYFLQTIVKEMKVMS